MPKSREDIADEARRDHRAGIVQAAVVGGVLAVCALTFPTQPLLDPGPSFVRWTSQGAWMHPHLLLMPIAQALASFLGSERAWYVLSALCWALAVPVAVAALQSMGLARVRALASVGIAFLAPMGMLAATTPGPFGAALLGASLVLFGLVGGPGLSPARHARRAALLWVAGCMLYMGHALLLPAVAVAVLARPRRERADRESPWIARGWLLAAPVVLGAVVLLADLVPATAPPGDFLDAILVALAGGPGDFLAKPYSVVLTLIPGLGVATIGVLGLALPQGKGRPAALWIGLWLAGAIVPPALMNMGRFALPAIAVLPVAAVGLAYGMGRLETPRAASRVALLGALSIVLLVGFHVVLQRGNPDRSWERRAAELLVTDDLFLTRDANHHYIAEERLGVDSLDLREPVQLARRYRSAYWRSLAQRVADAHSAGRRVVLDAGPRGSLAGIRDFPFRKELHRLGLKAPLVQLEQLAAEKRYDRYRAVQHDDLFPGEYEEDDDAATVDP